MGDTAARLTLGSAELLLVTAWASTATQFNAADVPAFPHTSLGKKANVFPRCLTPDREGIPSGTRRRVAVRHVSVCSKPLLFQLL